MFERGGYHQLACSKLCGASSFAEVRSIRASFVEDTLSQKGVSGLAMVTATCSNTMSLIIDVQADIDMVLVEDKTKL